jgi:CheY-like chemotaxis protein
MIRRACDGQEALELCSHEAPALAILDVIMPKLGGLGTAASLLKMFPGLPVVFTSGYSQSPLPSCTDRFCDIPSQKRSVKTSILALRCATIPFCFIDLDEKQIVALRLPPQSPI